MTFTTYAAVVDLFSGYQMEKGRKHMLARGLHWQILPNISDTSLPDRESVLTHI